MDSHHILQNLIYTSHCRKQIINRHLQTAFRSMRTLSDFDTEFQQFVQEESRLEASRILEVKDPSKTSFTLENLRKFSYKEQLHKFQKTTPILLGKSHKTESKPMSILNIILAISAMEQILKSLSIPA